MFRMWPPLSKPKNKNVSEKALLLPSAPSGRLEKRTFSAKLDTQGERTLLTPNERTSSKRSSREASSPALKPPGLRLPLNPFSHRLAFPEASKGGEKATVKTHRPDPPLPTVQ